MAHVFALEGMAMQDERLYLFAGSVVGWFIPAGHWLGINYWLWIGALVLLGLLDIYVAGAIVKKTFPIAYEKGWGIPSVTNEIKRSNLDKKSKMRVQIAVIAFAKATLLFGILVGQSMAIYFGR
ncbi:MAG: hypothetical protein H6R10_3121 [Rhodocyclaceae bacterium]|nr:hypothetical protein [Rhodocyclaceae bacterium]